MKTVGSRGLSERRRKLPSRVAHVVRLVVENGRIRRRYVGYKRTSRCETRRRNRRKRRTQYLAYGTARRRQNDACKVHSHDYAGYDLRRSHRSHENPQYSGDSGSGTRHRHKTTFSYAAPYDDNPCAYRRWGKGGSRRSQSCTQRRAVSGRNARISTPYAGIAPTAPGRQESHGIARATHRRLSRKLYACRKYEPVSVRKLRQQNRGM